jgi:hypothetical protein
MEPLCQETKHFDPSKLVFIMLHITLSLCILVCEVSYEVLFPILQSKENSFRHHPSTTVFCHLLGIDLISFSQPRLFIYLLTIATDSSSSQPTSFVSMAQCLLHRCRVKTSRTFQNRRHCVDTIPGLVRTNIWSWLRSTSSLEVSSAEGTWMSQHVKVCSNMLPDRKSSGGAHVPGKAWPTINIDTKHSQTRDSLIATHMQVRLVCNLCSECRNVSRLGGCSAR